MRIAIKIVIGLVIGLIILASLMGVEFYRNFVDYTNVFGTDTRYLTDTKNLSIVVHHTAAEGAQLAAIDRYHRDSCGWESGFAYHYFVTDTLIYRVHVDTARTIHAGNQYFNNNAIAVCVSGDFSKRKPSENEIKNLYYTLAYLCIIYDIPASRVYFHGEVSNTPTECCGKYLKPYIKLINRRESDDEYKPYIKLINRRESDDE